MSEALFALGGAIGVALSLLLVLTLVRPGLHIWPPPGPGTWQSYVFWILFRSLNVLCFAVAALTPSGFLGLPLAVRGLAGLLLAASLAAFVYAFKVLGRDNSYGASEGLVTSGVYGWTRNPQNAMLIVVYASLAIAADSGPVYLLAGTMMAVYALMVLLEEPWLEAHYGEAYRSYCRSVPRFFHWRRAWRSLARP